MVLSQTVRELCSQSRFGDGSTREELNGCQVRLNSPIGLYIYIVSLISFAKPIHSSLTLTGDFCFPTAMSSFYFPLLPTTNSR